MWDCVHRVCGGGGGCAGGGVPLGAVPVLSWFGEVSLGSINQSIKILKEPHTSTREATSQHHHTGSKSCVAK